MWSLIWSQTLIMYHTEYRGSFAGVGCALLRFVLPTCTGAPRQVVEFAGYLSQRQLLEQPAL
jgi:hypothetical protein